MFWLLTVLGGPALRRGCKLWAARPLYIMTSSIYTTVYYYVSACTQTMLILKSRDQSRETLAFYIYIHTPHQLQLIVTPNSRVQWCKHTWDPMSVTFTSLLPRSCAHWSTGEQLRGSPANSLRQNSGQVSLVTCHLLSTPRHFISIHFLSL